MSILLRFKNWEERVNNFKRMDSLSVAWITLYEEGGNAAVPALRGATFPQGREAFGFLLWLSSF